METYKIIGSGLFILITLNACSTDRLLNREKSRMSYAEDQTLQQSAEKHTSNSITRTYYTKDSSGYAYELNIFPLDTFFFSPENGFKVKASYITIRGKHDQKSTSADSLVQVLETQQKDQTSMEATVRQDERSTSKVKTKEKKFNYLVLIVLGLGVCWALWKAGSLKREA